jgi:hypothetical protein
MSGWSLSGARHAQLGESPVQPVDESVRFVQISAKLRALATLGGVAAQRLVHASLFDALKLAGDVSDLFVERRQQVAGLGRPGFADHLGIVSPNLNLRARHSRMRPETQRWIDGRWARAETVLVTEISEQMLLRDVERRLTTKYAHVAPEQVSSVVQAARARFDESPIRDFVPLLVERRARTELANAGQ